MEELFDEFPEPTQQLDGTNPPLTAPIRNYSPAIIDVCEKLYYRNSMLDDYRTCPNLMLYKWILGLSEDTEWVASIAGTAGHSCIEEIHDSKQFHLSHLELIKMWLKYFNETLKASSTPPQVSVKYATLKAQAEAISHDYAEMLEGYSQDKQNQDFTVTMCEQSFVLKLKDEFDRDFLFTGTIDQAGLYENGTFTLRDIKFRMNNFKPSRVELKLNTQLSLYAYALRHGSPSCFECAPKYTSDGELSYNGPCESCAAKIGTAAWPQLYVERCEIIWMREYTTRKRDEHTKWLLSDTEKEINPATGRSVKKKLINPEWLNGYKKGDKIGSGHLVTDRTQAFLQRHIRDLLVQAGMIRDGRFFRKAGPHCANWCKYSKPCVEGFESEVEELDVVQIAQNIMTTDPFSD